MRNGTDRLRALNVPLRVEVELDEHLRSVDDHLKRIVKYVAPGVGAGAKLMHDHFLTGDRQGAPSTVDQQTRTSAATA